MKKLFVILGVLLMAASVAGTSLEKPGEALNFTDSELQQLKQAYNNNTGEMPPATRHIIGGQRVNLHIGNQSYRMEMNSVKMTTLEKGELEDPTLGIHADTEAVGEILQSENPRSELAQQLDSGGIEYRAYGLVNRLKFRILELLV